MKKLIVILSLISLLSACKKSETTSVTPQDNFMNYNAGSTWNYQQTNSAGAIPVVTNYTLTSTTRDTTAGTRVYHVFASSNGRNQYLNKTGTDYYQFDTLPAAVSVGFYERLYLKSDLAQNQTWTQTFNLVYGGTSIPILATNTIVGKNLTHTVNGTAYTNVTHVGTTLSLVSPIPIVTLSTNLNAYYAKDYGLIENSTIINITGAITQSVNMSVKLMSALLR